MNLLTRKIPFFPRINKSALVVLRSVCFAMVTGGSTASKKMQVERQTSIGPSQTMSLGAFLTDQAPRLYITRA